jgi:pyrrolysine biosynthesis protein PylD
MTRLAASDIEHIAETLSDYEADLRLKTGHGLKGLACNAAGVAEKKLNAVLPRVRAQVVPVTWGEGLITGFAAAVAAILNRIGLAATVTRSANTAGIEEAVEKKCDLIFFSDDEDFIVLNLNQKTTVHNAAATGKGFAAGLDLMTGGISGCSALVVGCGPVGLSAGSELLRRGARVTVYDLDPDRCRCLLAELPNAGAGDVRLTDDMEGALRNFDRIVDATPAANLVRADMIGPRTFVSAPGMPQGLTVAAMEKIGLRLLHDPLQIGVATMAVEALSGRPV